MPGAKLSTWWHGHAEDHVFDSRLLRVVAAGARSPLAPMHHDTAPAAAPGRRPLVSVVIPCYNYAAFLREAAISAITQEGVDVEVIIVDDCSQDDSRDVARALAAEHPQISLIENDANSGHVRSFNAGCAAARGEFVVKLDADDLLAPGALARATALFEAHPTVGLVYGHPRHFSGAAPTAARSGAQEWIVWAGTEWLSERCRLGASAITNPEMVLRSSVMAAVGPMNPAVPYAPDMEISLRFAGVSDVGYVGGSDQAFHREHSSSMSETDGSGVLTDLGARSTAFDLALATLTDPSASQMRALARRALADDALRYAQSALDRGRVADAEKLALFAGDLDPDSLRRVPLQRQHGSLARLVGQLGRKVRSETHYARWMVNGV